MDQVIQQSPPNLSNEFIEEIFNKNNKNVLNTLTELWNISDKIPKKDKNKWDDIRETCDAFDEEMTKMMKSKKNDIDNK